MKLKNKIAVVTGASGGIGSAIAKHLDKEGCKVVLAARSIDTLQSLQNELKNPSLVVEMNVSSTESVAKAFSQVLQKFKTIDVLVNVAGVMPLTYLKNCLLYTSPSPRDS